MAGRGQHFIPQHFQTPFVIPDGKNQIWMYRRGKVDPILVSKADAAKQRDFYSGESLDGHPTLDDLITDYEQKLFLKVDQVRALKSGQFIPAELISEIVVHLAVRSAYVRNIYTEAVGSFFDIFSDIFQEGGAFLDEQVLGVSSCPPKIDSLLKEQIESAEVLKSTGVSSATFTRLGYSFLREKKTKIQQGVSGSLGQLKSGPLADVASFAADSHKKILSQGLAPVRRKEQLDKLFWSVVLHDNRPAILPDCVCFGIDRNGAAKPFISTKHDDFEAVIIALSPSTLAIGKVREDFVFDISEYNSLAASTCFDFFLSSEKQPDILNSILDIGEHVRDDLKGFINDSVTSSQWGLVPSKEFESISSADNLIERIQPRDSDNSAPLSLNFIDCADAEIAGLIGRNLYQLINKSLSPRVVSFIDGVTFTSDYEGELSRLGYKSESISKGQQGLAIPILVVRDGSCKVRLVMHSHLCTLLLSSDEADYSLAHTVIAHTLVSTEFLFILNEKFPEKILLPITDPLESFLQQYTKQIVMAYYIARIANIQLQSIEEQESVLGKKLISAFSKTEEQRRSYREDGNLDKFFSLAVGEAGDILNSFVTLWGSRSLAEQEQPITKLLMEVLVSHELHEWALLFQQDLGSFYNNLSEWSDYEEIFFVNRHLERLLFAFGILVELKNNKTIYLHVPLGFDAEYLNDLVENK
jgi:hypothetical protein